ncbi:NADPH-dependent oxidoreductase [Marinospirillum alkaliphilum]|uniref:Nitroreductase n=1 Tax=Marinospirillum alkaliphilum DSM 21637 TaxID=1122209 RepID=A0A1K1TXK8_9GAMM|nr:NADPH-dependent oxidoreductase [Marinospirillum alkaliphilum]SFX05060.1 Nitroreductase [Marinospirillum alkaliphilum DSM 21637]
MTTPTKTLWQERYRDDHQQERLISNPVIEQILAHRSVRAYSDQPLPEGWLETLLATAQSAATSSNLQVWSLLVVEDPARKERLSKIARQAHVARAPAILVWLADFSRIQQQATKRGAELPALDYFDSALIGSVDAALAAQNAALAAESLGLGTVYLGSLRNDLQATVDELQLPPLVFPVFGMAIGYPDPDKPAAIKPRLPQAVILHRETYQPHPQQDELISAFDQRLGEFYQEQKINVSDWSGHVIERLQDIDAGGTARSQIGPVIRRQGYPMR